MIPHTQAYARFREQGIELYDFLVLVSYAIPCLEREIDKIEGEVEGKIPPSVYLKNEGVTAEELGRRMDHAGQNLGKELLLSSFSYFEAYVEDVLREIIDFHGGVDEVQDRFSTEVQAIDKDEKEKFLESKRKIQDSPDPGLVDKYAKYNSELRDAGYIFPSQRLSGFGWKALAKRLNRFRAADIPELLVDALGCPLEQRDLDKFQNLRDRRNQIAHGRLAKFPVRDAVEHGRFLREVAVTVDTHVVEHFLLLELPRSDMPKVD